MVFGPSRFKPSWMGTRGIFHFLFFSAPYGKLVRKHRNTITEGPEASFRNYWYFWRSMKDVLSHDSPALTSHLSTLELNVPCSSAPHIFNSQVENNDDVSLESTVLHLISIYQHIVFSHARSEAHSTPFSGLLQCCMAVLRLRAELWPLVVFSKKHNHRLLNPNPA